MSTIDNLIDLKDEAVSLAYSVKAAMMGVGENVEWFSVRGPTARALYAQAQAIIDLQELHDQENERDLSNGVAISALPPIPLHGEKSLTEFEFELLMAAHRYMLDHPEKNAILVSDLKEAFGFKQNVTIIGTAFHRLFKKGYVNRFVSYGEPTYWKPLTKEEVTA